MNDRGKKELPPDASLPVVEAAQFRKMTRRQLLALAPLASLGALAVPAVRERILPAGLGFADGVSQWLTRPTQLAATWTADELTPFDEFPYNSYGKVEPEIDFASWALLVEGMVTRPGKYSLADIQSLPKQTQNVRHICIEGWSVVGSFGGVRFADFLAHVGADPAARYVQVACYDDYYSSYDMASCQHPQSLLCYEMYGRPLNRGHGAPLRVHMPTKLGYKSAKYLFSLRVSNVLAPQRGFWEDQGYSWHGGI